MRFFSDNAAAVCPEVFARAGRNPANAGCEIKSSAGMTGKTRDYGNRWNIIGNVKRGAATSRRRALAHHFTGRQFSSARPWRMGSKLA